MGSVVIRPSGCIRDQGLYHPKPARSEPMKVIGYIRVSTDDQALSLEVQQAKVRSYCGLYDLELVDLIIDDGLSARSMNRPGLQTALKMLRAGFAKGLVIAKLDR